MSNYVLELSPDTIAFVSVIANIVLVGIVIFQYRDSIKHYKSINRPWLVFGGGDTVIGEIYFHFHLENIGNLPAEKIEIKTECLFHFGKDDVKKEVSNESTKVGIIMPKQKYPFIINDLAIDDIIGTSFYKVNVFVTYYFGDEKKMCTFELYENNTDGDKVISCVEAD